MRWILSGSLEIVVMFKTFLPLLQISPQFAPSESRAVASDLESHLRGLDTSLAEITIFNDKIMSEKSVKFGKSLMCNECAGNFPHGGVFSGMLKFIIW